MFGCDSGITDQLRRRRRRRHSDYDAANAVQEKLNAADNKPSRKSEKGVGEKGQDTLTNLQLPTTVDINLRDIYELEGKTLIITCILQV